MFQRVAQGHKVTNHQQIRKVDQIDDMLLTLTILSFLRGISYFRLFKSTRYFTQLVYQVILNSRAFSIVLFYSTVAMGFLLYIVFEFQYSFSDSLSYSFQINLDYLDPSDFNSTQWVVYSFGITLNYLMMMSLLVSIYADTFVKVMARAEIENCRALAVMSLEAERNMFWNRTKTKKEYLMLCNKDYLEEDDDPVLSKVKQVKASIKNMQNQLTVVFEIRKGIDKVINLNRKIIKTLPTSLNRADKKNNAVLLLSLLITVKKTENPQVRAMGLKKIFKVIKKLS